MSDEQKDRVRDKARERKRKPRELLQLNASRQKLIGIKMKDRKWKNIKNMNTTEMEKEAVVDSSTERVRKHRDLLKVKINFHTPAKTSAASISMA